MTFDTVLSLIVIALLIPTITFSVILNRRLSALRNSRDELAKVVASFNDATLRAEAGIPKLKKATNEASMALKDRVEKAQSLRDDLAFMIERAEEMSVKLESGVRVARSEASFGAAAGQPSVTATATPVAPAYASNLRPPVSPEPAVVSRTTAVTPAAKAPGLGITPFEETAADLRNALNAARAEARATEARQDARTPQAPVAASAAAPLRAQRKSIADELGLTADRSEAERELLKALQSTR